MSAKDRQANFWGNSPISCIKTTKKAPVARKPNN